METSKNQIQQINEFEKKALEIRQEVTSRQDEHNMELVAEVKGVSYVNDSKTSTVEGLCASIENVEAPVLLIVGGHDKDNDYSSLSNFRKKRIKAIVYLGNDEENIFKNYKNDSMMFVTAINIEEAVRVSYWYAKSGDVVLFSPACPANAFDSYRTRGEEFIKAVKALRG